MSPCSIYERCRTPQKPAFKGEECAMCNCALHRECFDALNAHGEGYDGTLLCGPNGTCRQAANSHSDADDKEMHEDNPCAAGGDCGHRFSHRKHDTVKSCGHAFHLLCQSKPCSIAICVAESEKGKTAGVVGGQQAIPGPTGTPPTPPEAGTILLPQIADTIESTPTPAGGTSTASSRPSGPVLPAPSTAAATTAPRAATRGSAAAAKSSVPAAAAGVPAAAAGVRLGVVTRRTRKSAPRTVDSQYNADGSARGEGESNSSDCPDGQAAKIAAKATAAMNVAIKTSLRDGLKAEMASAAFSTMLGKACTLPSTVAVVRQSIKTALDSTVEKGLGTAADKAAKNLVDSLKGEIKALHDLVDQLESQVDSELVATKGRKKAKAGTPDKPMSEAMVSKAVKEGIAVSSVEEAKTLKAHIDEVHAGVLAAADKVQKCTVGIATQSTDYVCSKVVSEIRPMIEQLRGDLLAEVRNQMVNLSRRQPSRGDGEYMNDDDDQENRPRSKMRRTSTGMLPYGSQSYDSGRMRNNGDRILGNVAQNGTSNMAAGGTMAVRGTVGPGQSAAVSGISGGFAYVPIGGPVSAPHMLQQGAPTAFSGFVPYG